MSGFPSLLETAFNGWSSLDATIQREIARTRTFLRIAHPPEPEQADPTELARVVEREIIPRLMLAHSAEPRADAAGAPSDADHLTTMIRLSLKVDPAPLMEFVGRLIDQKIEREALYVGLLIPTARRLGEMWEQDLVSFTDVTIGLGRLQQLVHTYGWRRDPEAPNAEERGSVLFAAPAEEQHTFGLFIIEDDFRRAGWRTLIELAAPEADIAAAVSARWFDVFGVSVSRMDLQPAAKRLVETVRAKSCNRDIQILAGGRLFSENPDQVSIIGADAVATSGAEALLIAGNTVRRHISGI